MVQYVEGIPVMVVNNLQERIRKSKRLGTLKGASVQELAKESTGNIDFDSMLDIEDEVIEDEL
ncbi:hypothetical protein [Clostridium perfringens]|uniref:hypothetical protein n=1 Tax=Clostridium perfringens TaxID=1502 RepID=UPI0039E7F966